MSYCAKHQYQQNQCIACVREAIERQTQVLVRIERLLLVDNIPKLTLRQKIKRGWKKWQQ